MLLLDTTILHEKAAPLEEDHDLFLAMKNLFSVEWTSWRHYTALLLSKRLLGPYSKCHLCTQMMAQLLRDKWA